MAEAGDGGMGVAPGAENGAAAQPMVAHAAGRVRAAPGVAPAVQAVANAAPPVVAVPAAPVADIAVPLVDLAAPVVDLAAPVVDLAAVVLAAAPVAAMLAGPVILNPAAPPTFDVDGVLMGPLPRKSTMTLCEILPRVED